MRFLQIFYFIGSLILALAASGMIPSANPPDQLTVIRWILVSIAAGLLADWIERQKTH